MHYTDSAREALDLANKSYERLVEESEERHELSILINRRDAERADFERKERERTQEKENERLAVKPLHVETSVPAIVKPEDR